MRAAAATWARMPHKTDASGIHRLISECPPLDLNSVYTYLLLSEHFSRACIVAGRGDTLDGFVSAYLPPERPGTLFVWQVAVHARARGQGLDRKSVGTGKKGALVNGVQTCALPISQQRGPECRIRPTRPAFTALSQSARRSISTPYTPICF